MAIERVGFGTGSNSNISFPTDTRAGDLAFLVCRASVNSATTPEGWERLGGRNISGISINFYIRTVGSTGTFTFPNPASWRLEVWRGVGGYTASDSTPTKTGDQNSTSLTGTPVGSIPMWGFGNLTANAVTLTAPEGVNGYGAGATTIFYGQPTTSEGVPAMLFKASGSGTLTGLTLALHPAAPPYNMFRIDAAGETGLTPYLLGDTAGQDTEIRWTP